jgi:hypothetical protein
MAVNDSVVNAKRQRCSKPEAEESNYAGQFQLQGRFDAASLIPFHEYTGWKE